MMSRARLLSLGGWLLLAVLLLLLPRVFPSGYLINTMIATAVAIIFALSFDLSAGHVGTVSLGHPVFFGVGAYVTAIVGTALGFGYIGNVLLSAVTMALLALLSGVAFFRISQVSFAIGTLGAIIIAQLVANNAYELTGGPLCIQSIPRPTFAFPWDERPFRVVRPENYYYLLLPLLGLTVVIYRMLTTSRIGRAFAAVREDEVRAMAIGIHPLRYKLLAFAVGGGLIGALGSFQAQYVTVVCPSELALSYTLNLLIIVFVGGAGRLRGVIMGAVLFSLLPRLLESGGAQAISAPLQQVIYGLILLVVVRFMPDGLDGLLTRLTAQLAARLRQARGGGA